MKEVLEPLASIPGVRAAVLVTPDGVPVVVRGRGAAQESQQEQSAESLAALASAWMNTLSRDVAPLSWNPPERAVLRASRGTLVMLHAPGSVLLALLDVGARPEDLRLPMQGAVARMQRILRSYRESGTGDPAGALPATNAESSQDPRQVPTDTGR